MVAALSRLQVSKASGVDNIRASILRVTTPAIARSLCHLLNLNLHSGVVPSEWKAAKIIPVPKSKARGSVSFGDFRPISVLPIIAKVFESQVHSQDQSLGQSFSAYLLMIYPSASPEVK